MKNPPHPGDILKHDVLEPLDLTVTETAERLGVSRVALSRVLNGRAAISADMAVRLEPAGASTARFWLGLQANHDLARVLEREQTPVKVLDETAA